MSTTTKIAVCTPAPASAPNRSSTPTCTPTRFHVIHSLLAFLLVCLLIDYYYLGNSIQVYEYNPICEPAAISYTVCLSLRGYNGIGQIGEVSICSHALVLVATLKSSLGQRVFVSYFIQGLSTEWGHYLFTTIG